MAFSCNIGPRNRIARALTGIALIAIAAAYARNAVLASVLILGGIVSIWEAIAGYCVVQGFFGTRDMR